MIDLFYRQIVRRALFRLDAETAHHFAMGVLSKISRSPGMLTLLHRLLAREKPVEAFGLHFPNPVGLAAGFDKNAAALPAWAALGFGFVEMGTITAQAQPGNPQPRIFRYPQTRALINRLGFNNDGAEIVAQRLQTWRDTGLWPSVPVGINLGKSKITPLEEAEGDYLASFERLHPFADYLALNVSSPNTPGLRQLQERGALESLLRAVQARNQMLPTPKPLLVKIAPDLTWPQIEEIIGLARDFRLAGLIATNTTLDHSSVAAWGDQTGGLSGAPLEARSTEIVRFITRTSPLPVIAVGGILSADDARRKFDAGAILIQLYTGYIYSGPTLVPEIVRL